jgi:hypothetical protein
VPGLSNEKERRQQNINKKRGLLPRYYSRVFTQVNTKLEVCSQWRFKSLVVIDCN